MRRPALFMMLVPFALAACATHDPGWRGAGAEPFDGAKAACEAEVATVDAHDRGSAFEACMARRGWAR